MAEFCKQCSIDHFGKDDEDFANRVTEQEAANGYLAIVLCESCGAIQVDRSGTCVSEDCLLEHGKNSDIRKVHGY